MKAIAKAVGFYYIPTLGQMRKKGCKNCYYSYDGHPMATGDTEIFQIISLQIQAILNRIYSQ